MSYIGREPTFGSLESQTLTGNGSTTQFTLNYAVSTSASVLVTVDGIFKVPSVEYGAQGTMLNFAAAPANAASICVVFLGRELLVPTPVGRTIEINSYVGDNVDVTFDLTSIPVAPQSIFVYVDGLLKKITTDYTISGQTVTFTSAPTTSAKIELVNLGAEKILDVASVEDGSIELVKLSSAATKSLYQGDWQSIKTGNFTAVAPEYYMIDTSGGAITMTLPLTATLGDTVRFMDVAGTFNTNNLTVDRNGHKIMGSTTNMTVDTQGSSNALVYSNATYGWRLLDL